MVFFPPSSIQTRIRDHDNYQTYIKLKFNSVRNFSQQKKNKKGKKRIRNLITFFFLFFKMPRHHYHIIYTPLQFFTARSRVNTPSISASQCISVRFLFLHHIPMYLNLIIVLFSIKCKSIHLVSYFALLDKFYHSLDIPTPYQASVTYYGREINLSTTLRNEPT